MERSFVLTCNCWFLCEKNVLIFEIVKFLTELKRESTDGQQNVGFHRAVYLVVSRIFLCAQYPSLATLLAYKSLPLEFENKFWGL